MGHRSVQAIPSAVASARSDVPGFSAVLREATADVHRQAERAGFIADLLRGRATREGYALFLRNLVPVYAALEAALDLHVGDLHAGDAGHAGDMSHAGVPAAFADPRLRRLPSLLADLDALAGPRWERTMPALPEADAYARAIRDVGHGHRLTAHAYARLLGDLSGGQILKPLLARLYGIGPEALAFYDFPALADLHAPKMAMRAALDAVPPDGADAFVTEAIAAFGHNIALSNAVSDAVRGEAMAALTA